MKSCCTSEVELELAALEKYFMVFSLQANYAERSLAAAGEVSADFSG
jgi:hypothetical protein